MPALRDLQKGVRDALIMGDTSALDRVLVGGRDAKNRLAIHQRHYNASLVTAMLDRFPATVWLVGSAFVEGAAREFARHHPPTRPCIADYGADFPAFLATRPGGTELPYLSQFAELEWHLSRLSISVDARAVMVADLSTLDAATLGDARLTLQPGVHYFHADWAIDELISLYLSDSAPDRFSLPPGDVWLELRGARGELRMSRLSRADFAFRGALATGDRLGDAAISALEIDAAFDAGRALLNLVGDGLVLAIDTRQAEGAQ